MRQFLPLSAILLLMSLTVFSQKKLIQGREGMLPSFVTFDPGNAPVFSKGVIQVTDANARITATVTASKIAGIEKDQTGMESYRYQQTINGIPVEHAYYIVHTRGQKVVAQNGKWIKDVPQSLPVASITEADALGYALRAVNAVAYKWQDAAEEAFLKREQQNSSATFYPKGELVYYSGEEDVIPTALRPAYKFDIYASEPLSRQLIFVDAVNGKILGSRELIHTGNATGTAVTAYSGTQSITTDQVSSSSYRLRETGRGNGIETYNMQKGTNYNKAVDFTDADNYWNNVNTNLDQYATDAHWGAEETYDYYKVKYNRNSIDNAGFAIKSYVHYSRNYFNAFWDGSRMTYGDGSSTDNNKPLTALDVCGHEITHGLTSFTSNLTYSNESGAMNEGFSDIFGTAIEFFARPSNADWLIGGDFYTIRSMSNPNAYSQPDTYKGTYWYSGTSDNGGVHTNSGVLNFWFYLLSAGGSGTNDNGFAYNVSGIGIDKAAAIAYKTNTQYLVSTSKYADARIYSIQAATDLFGAASNEVTQTINAWDAVGVGATTAPPPQCTDTYEPNESISAAKSIQLNTDLTAMIGTSTDKDWYVFSTTTSQPNFKITLTNLPADYDMKLYNSSGRQIAVSQNSGTTDESITRNTTSAGTWYLQIYGYSGAYNASSCYQFKVITSGTSLLTGATEGIVAGNKPGGDLFGNELAVYPNPVRGSMNVYVNAANSSRSQLKMIDIAGRMVMNQTLQLQKGMNTIAVDVARLAPGTYLIKMDGLNTVKVQVAQ